VAFSPDPFGHDVTSYGVVAKLPIHDAVLLKYFSCLKQLKYTNIE